MNFHSKAAVAVSMVALMAFGSTVFASSHREAPLISSDPEADNTDFYFFVSPDKPDTATAISCVNPFEHPMGGPNYNKFGDEVLYEIHFDNNADAQADISYQFEFETTRQNDNTFLYNTGPITSLDDPDWNVRQNYQVKKVEPESEVLLGAGLIVPPSNIGPQSTPNHDALTSAAIRTLTDGTVVVAGQFDDPFFVDLGIFDLLAIRDLPGNNGGGIDGVQGYNTHCIALQIPKQNLTSDNSIPTNAESDSAIVGAWSSTSRRTTTVLRVDGQSPEASGDWIQVSRLGMPLVNEVVIPLGDKDRWNHSKPKNDAQFANYVTNPELGVLFNALYDIQVPPQAPFGEDNQRDDLIAVYLTGLAGLNQPSNVVPSEQMRLNLAIAPATSPNSLGVVGGDNAGFPNGRRLADDVTDVSLKAVAGGIYPLFHPEFVPDAVAGLLGDGVDANDVSFKSTFPYLASAHRGFESVPHGDYTVVNETIVESTIASPGDIIKALGDTAVYFIGEDGKKHVFANETIFNSWGFNFDNLLVVRADQLSTIPSGKAVPVKPGTWLIKSISDPRVYAVDESGKIRHIASETVAIQLYGADWVDVTFTVTAEELNQYFVGDPITSASDFNVSIRDQFIPINNLL